MKNTYYNYRRLSINSLEIFITKRISLSKSAGFNDPFDGQLDLSVALKCALQHASDSNTHYKEFLEEMSRNIDVGGIVKATNNMGIFCLSAKESSILMWSHYADKHKGFCIGFNFENSELEKHTHKVNYTYGNPYIESLILESITEKDKDEFVRRLVNAGILHKHKKWKYEKEYRLIINDKNEYPIEPKMIREIIFGLKMLPSHKRILKHLLSGPEWEHIAFRQSEQNGTNLSLKIRPANENDYRVR